MNGFETGHVGPLGSTQVHGNGAIDSQTVTTCTTCDGIRDGQAGTVVTNHVEDDRIVARAHGDGLCADRRCCIGTHTHDGIARKGACCDGGGAQGDVDTRQITHDACVGFIASSVKSQQATVATSGVKVQERTSYTTCQGNGASVTCRLYQLHGVGLAVSVIDGDIDHGVDFRRWVGHCAGRGVESHIAISIELHVEAVLWIDTVDDAQRGGCHTSTYVEVDEVFSQSVTRTCAMSNGDSSCFSCSRIGQVESSEVVVGCIGQTGGLVASNLCQINLRNTAHRCLRHSDGFNTSYLSSRIGGHKVGETDSIGHCQGIDTGSGVGTSVDGVVGVDLVADADGVVCAARGQCKGNCATGCTIGYGTHDASRNGEVQCTCQCRSINRLERTGCVQFAADTQILSACDVQGGQVFSNQRCNRVGRTGRHQIDGLVTFCWHSCILLNAQKRRVDIAQRQRRGVSRTSQSGAEVSEVDTVVGRSAV